MYLAIALILFSFQQSKPETVALVFGPEPVRYEIVNRDLATKEHERLSRKSDLTDKEKKLLAALVQALGVQSQIPRLGTRERLDWEIRRGVRLPLQNPEPIKQ